MPSRRLHEKILLVLRYAGSLNLSNQLIRSAVVQHIRKVGHFAPDLVLRDVDAAGIFAILPAFFAGQLKAELLHVQPLIRDVAQHIIQQVVIPRCFHRALIMLKHISISVTLGKMVKHDARNAFRRNPDFPILH